MIGLYPSISLDADRVPDRSKLVGSEIAAQEFTRSLLRHQAIQQAALIVFDRDFSATNWSVQRFQQNENIESKKLIVCPVGRLGNFLNEENILVLHNAKSPQLDDLSYLRTQFASQVFPITCLTHGLGRQTMLWEYYARLAFAPTLPCDSVICTSKAARHAFANNLDQMADGLRAVGFESGGKSLRLDVVPLGVDVDLFHPRDKTNLRRLLGLPQNKTLLLYFGRIDGY